EAADVSVSQAWLEAAVQVIEELVAGICTELIPPGAGVVEAVGFSEMPVPGAPCCGMGRNCCVPLRGVTVVVALRPEGDELLAAVRWTVPAPAPDDPEVIVIQSALFTAVHCKAGASVITARSPAPPVAGTVAVVGLLVRAPPCWVTVRVCAAPPA